MNIDKYKQEDGSYVDEDNCSYESAELFIQSKILRFCGCGNRMSNLRFVANALRQIDNLKFVHEKNKTYEEWDNECLNLFGNEGVKYFIFYFFDREGFTEHGGSVPGWLTKKGIELLEDLEELIIDQNEK